MQTVKGVMTNATIKPATKDKGGYPKNPAFLALTFKIELDEFTDAELGNLLVTSARGEEVGVSLETSQLMLDMPDGVEPVEE